ncbi:unnamed protein product [Polarella glacialis]|uniref:Ion transport domain-containing protein n=1 Tax=Polarella glacialis TaxID=89957 RepID=A0A813H0G3_POLGL|nr:unnamed protein product [Polarella glacialis]
MSTDGETMGTPEPRPTQLGNVLEGNCGTIVTVEVNGKQKQVCRMSCFIFPADSSVRMKVLAFVEWKWFDRFILLCIVVNSLAMAVYDQRGPNDSGLNFVIDSIIDNILTAIFLLECLLKILAWGFCIDQTTYLRDPWNVLDFVVVVSGVIGWLPGTADSGLSFLRLFRVLRPLRSLNAVPQMKVLVNTVISSVPRLGNVSVMGAFLFVVFGIIGTTLLTGIFYRQCREADPILVNACWSWNSTNEGRLCGGRNMCEAGGFCRGHEEDPIEDYRPIFPGGKQGFPWCEGSAPAKVFPETDFVHFDHIIGAVILVFQCMTLEGWTDLMYMVQDGFNTPLAWVYFLILVMITSFFMLNVALAVVDEARDDFEDGSSKNDTDLEDDVDMFESIADPDPVMWHESNFVRYAYRFAYWEPFTNFIMLIIAGNVISMMLEVFPPQVAWDPGLNICGKVFLGIFVFEMMVMLVALGPKGYVKNVSTAFDGAVVTVSIIEEIMGGSSGLKALRTLRFFRVLGKLAKKWQAFGILLKAMMHTGMALRYWLVLFILVLYIFTLMFIQFFALEFHFKDPDSLAAMDDSQGQMWCAGNEDRPWNYRQDCIPRAHFDTFLWGFVTIFQIMTGENWNTIMYAGMRSKGAGFSFLFVIIILFGQILFLSLFLSMLISKFDEVQDTLEEAAYRMNALNAASKSSGGLSASSSDLDQKKMGLPPQVESSSGPSFSITKKSSQVAPQPDDDELMECATSLDEDDEVPDPTTEAGKKIAGVFVKAEDGVPSPTTEAGKKIAGVFVRAVSRDLQSLKGTRESKEGVKKDFSPQRSLGSQRSLDSHKEKGKVLSPPALAKWPRGYSWFMMTTANPIRRLAHFLLVFEIRGCQVFDNFILVCILLNSLCMGIDNPLTDPSLWYSIMLRELDVIFSIIFIIEMALKVLAYPVLWGENAYLRSGWNVLDGTVVLVSILGFIAFEGAGTLKTLRIIRALRPLRVISRNQNLKVVVQTVFASLQDLVSLIIVFTLVLLIFALFALMYLNGQFYRCEEEVRFMTSDTDNFVTPLCLGGNILDSSVALGKWEPPYGWDTAGESCNGNLPMQWARASSDTPLCLARCDPLWESEVPPPAWLCPRKYETTEELPAVCTDPNRVPTAAEEIGWTYVNSMQRVLVVPCGGSTIFNGSVVTPASAVSCRANFCPQGASEERRSECQFECEIHPTFCKATCDADSNSAACQSCHQECQASCECQPFCEGVIRDAALCTEQGSKWMPYVQQNFDNILNAMITLFEISTTEGWVDVMYAASDSVDFYRQPVRDYQMGLWAPFFVLWIFLSFMFLINLSVGVIVDKFMDFRAAGKSLGMTPNQQKWMQSRKSLHGRMVFFDLCDLDRLPPMRKWVYHLTSSKRFEHVVVIAIIINTLFMTFKIFPSPTEWWEPMQDIVNYVCSIIFLIEAILKLFALRRNYWKDYWNCFDFACVLATLLGIAIRYGTGLDMKSITSVIRIFRIARLFRLLRFLKGLNRLFLALVISLPKLVNVVLILLLLLVLFGILGVSLFSCAKFSETLNVHGNFRDFFWAFTTLFRSSTGEAWNNIMHDLSKDETTFFREGTWCSPYTLFDLEGKWDVLKDKCLISDPNMCVMTSPFSRYNWIPKAYWISFTLLITLMIMNLVIAVILEGYEEGKSNPATEIVDTCVDIWKKYDPNHKLLLGIDKVNLFINEVLITANANATAVPAFVLNDDGEIDFGQFPMKYAKIFDLKVTDENQVSFISACRQVLKLNVIQDDMAMIHELDEADSQLNPAALAKLLKMETKTTGVSDSNEDLLHKIAAVKLQRRFRARSLYRKSIAADFTETQAFAASAFIGLQPQIGRRPSAADLRSSGAATSGHGGSQQVVMMCPPVAG